MSSSTEYEAYELLRSERRWNTAERITLRVVAIATAIFFLGLVVAGTVLVLDAETVPANGVMDQ